MNNKGNNQQSIYLHFIERIMIALCSCIFLLYIISCTHSIGSRSSNSDATETDAVVTLFLSFINDGIQPYQRAHSNYVVEVIFLAKGSPGWDGNITPLPNQFGSAPVAWLSNLSNHGITIKDVRDAVYSKELRFIIDRDTGKAGEIFQVEKITRISLEEYHVDAQRYSGPMDAIGARYILRRKNGAWYVAGAENHWIQ